MKQINNLKYNIKMFKGYDKNNKPFTAICILSNKEEELLNDFNKNNINLT